MKTQRVHLQALWMAVLCLMIPVAFAAADEKSAVDIYVSVDGAPRPMAAWPGPTGPFRMQWRR